MHLIKGSELQQGKYRILRVLGQGGFGITYLAENILLDKMVAIKEFFPKNFCGRDNTSHVTIATQNNEETVGKLKVRFLKEARNIARLDHPGIVRIHDIFEENNTAYYVMEYIEGENLNDIVKKNGPLQEYKAIEYIRKVGESLAYIHSRNMTHFDVKPANIVIRKKDDIPVLIDFGLSKQYDDQGHATSTLMQAVSEGYSPIEMYNTGNDSSFSPQTDVYSLGATLYFLLSGKSPISASELFEKDIDFQAISTQSIRATINQAMMANRKMRTKSVSAFIENLCHVKEENISQKEETIYIANDSTIQIDQIHIPDKQISNVSYSFGIIGLIICYIISSLVEWGMILTEKIYCLIPNVEFAQHYSLLEIIDFDNNEKGAIILSLLFISQCILIPILIVLRKRYFALISFIIIGLFLYPLLGLTGIWILDFTKSIYIIIPFIICFTLLIGNCKK